MRNLEDVTEGGSVTSSRRSRSHHGSRRALSPGDYVPPQVETELSRPELGRRHTEAFDPRVMNFTALPPNYSDLSRVPPRPVQRSLSSPQVNGHDNIDMNLAYGALPHDITHPEDEEEKEVELAATMSKLDMLLLEAHCLQHSATEVIANLQANPEAMAAVALTLAEISSLIGKMSPGILATLKASSPAIFALLASPQFLIAGGLAFGVTVVMFGGYKIIKKIQADNQEKKQEASRMEEAMVWDAHEMGSVESWRRGIADVEERSIATSVDGEFITPEAARQRKERIKDRRREEREENGSVRSSRTHRTERTERSERTVRRATSESTIRQKALPAPSEAGRSSVSRSTTKTKEGKEKKKNTLSDIFRKNKDKKEKEKVHVRSSTLSFRPKVIEL